MKTVSIKNIGPIISLKLSLNKVNVIIGPQGSGKSTIAKILSYCEWVEKRYILDGEYKYDFMEKFMVFHRIEKSFFSDRSLIIYESDYIKLTLKGRVPKHEIVSKKEVYNFLNSKNIFIPAERNFVSVVPNLGQYKEANDNIMNFIYDWYDAKKNYSTSKRLPILNFNISYFHIKKTDSDRLILNNLKKGFSLETASSGLQSITPLLILVDYLTNGIYKKESLNSVKEKENINDLITKYFKRLAESDFNNFLKVADNKDDISFAIERKNLEKILEIVKRRIFYSFSQFIIEEPEQNLFPLSQRDLIYYLIKKVNDNRRDHKILITTHSPYILYALNNCIMGYNIKERVKSDNNFEFQSKESWINPEKVSIWEIDSKTGSLINIQNKDNGTVDKNYFNNVMNELMDEYYEMLDIL